MHRRTVQCRGVIDTTPEVRGEVIASCSEAAAATDGCGQFDAHPEMRANRLRGFERGLGLLRYQRRLEYVCAIRKRANLANIGSLTQRLESPDYVFLRWPPAVH